MNGGGGNTEALWNWTALFTDECKSADTFSQRNDADQRNLQTNDGVLTAIYNKAQQARGYARDAINALLAYDQSADRRAAVGEMYMVMGYAEMQMSEDFCNGIPFGETVTDCRSTRAAHQRRRLKLAIARFDSALTTLGVGDATHDASTQVQQRDARRQGAARRSISGSSPARRRPSAPFRRRSSTRSTTRRRRLDNEWWVMGPSVQRYSAGDSVDVTGQVLQRDSVRVA